MGAVLVAAEFLVGVSDHGCGVGAVAVDGAHGLLPSRWRGPVGRAAGPAP